MLEPICWLIPGAPKIRFCVPVLHVNNIYLGINVKYFLMSHFFFSFQILQLISKRNSIRNTILLGIVLLDGILDLMLLTKPVISFTSTLARYLFFSWNQLFVYFYFEINFMFTFFMKSPYIFSFLFSRLPFSFSRAVNK